MPRDSKGRFVPRGGSAPSPSPPVETSAKGGDFAFATVDGTVPGMQDLIARIKDVPRALDEVGASVVLETQMRFEAQKDPNGAAWQALAPTTIARRTAGKASKILRETGDNLYDTLTHRVDGGSAVLIGVNRSWAAIHQFGGTAGRGKKVTIPARPFLGLSEEGAVEVLHILRDHLEAS